MGDYIERKRVIDLITSRYENPEICAQEINEIPAADVAPVVHGRRIKTMPILGAGNVETHCSVCGRILHEENAPYCYCGAKFEEKDGFK